MTLVDYFILGIIVVSSLLGLIRGFVREAFSLAAWLLAFWVSWTFFRDFSIYLEWITIHSARLAVSFGLLFLVALMLGALVNYLIVHLVNKTGLSGMDRIIGLAFGAARGVLLVTIIVLLAGLTLFPNDQWWHQSELIGYFETFAIWLRDLLPPDIARKFSYQ